jgi:two-component system, cell cycle response regulator
MSDPDIRKANEEIARKFGEIEADLAVCRGIGELFERLLSGSEEAFGVPFVWLSLLRKPETEALLKLLRKSGILRDRINIIAPASFLEIVPDVAQPLLASGDLRPFFRLMPPNVKYFLRSLAIAPLTRHGALIGSLNHGDASPDRYRPGMETALLDHLARTVSEQLSRFPMTGAGSCGQ